MITREGRRVMRSIGMSAIVCIAASVIAMVGHGTAAELPVDDRECIWHLRCGPDYCGSSCGLSYCAWQPGTICCDPTEVIGG